jgi:phosphatidylglycerophosphatase A
MQYIELLKRIRGVMVSVHASGEGNRGFKPWSGQTKHCIIGICFQMTNCQLHHGESRIYFDEIMMMMMSALFSTNTLSWIVIVVFKKSN